MKRLVFFAFILVSIGLILFEVDVNFQFTLPKVTNQINNDQEIHYLNCIEARDKSPAPEFMFVRFSIICIPL